MTERFSDSEASRESLSALVDGQAGSDEVARACAAWRDDGQARAKWHEYQLIGDVMRSDDLAQASGSAAFLAHFRDRLAKEPVVLAPQSAEAVRHGSDAAVVVARSDESAQTLRHRRWSGPVAVAAGFLMVMGLMFSSQMPPATSSGELIGQTSPSGQAVGGGLVGGDLALVSSPANAGGSALLASAEPSPHGASMAAGADSSFSRPNQAVGVLIRDPQLDQVLESRRNMSRADMSFASQGGLARQVVFEAP
jgi:sigma-E factor negative regulatory protein RseA